jgi:hypothetical protein
VPNPREPPGPGFGYRPSATRLLVTTYHGHNPYQQMRKVSAIKVGAQTGQREDTNATQSRRLANEGFVARDFSSTERSSAAATVSSPSPASTATSPSGPTSIEWPVYLGPG